jgi:hypothetical protein
MSSRLAEESPIPKASADAWRQCQPSDAQVTRAYARFLGRPAPRPLSMASALAWLAAGMLIGTGTLYAAAGGRLGLWPASSPPSAPVESGRRVAPPAPHSGPRRDVPSPSTVEAVPSGSSASVDAPAPPAAKASAETWQRVARGLRESDLDGADEALLKLSRQGTEDERDVAKLVRAQVLTQQGRTEEARGLLLELRHAASATTRNRAAVLLQQLAPTGPSHRSFDPEPGTNSR